MTTDEKIALLEDENRRLRELVSPVTFNNTDAKPAEVKWTFSPDLLERKVKEYSNRFISDIKYVGFTPDNRGNVTVILWIHANSKHFRDESTVNTVLGKAIPKYSTEIKEFANKFGDMQGKNKDIRKVIVVSDEDKTVKGLRINLFKFLSIMLDMDCVEYSKYTGEKVNRNNLDMAATWHFKSHKNNPYEEIEFLEVTKRQRNVIKERPPRRFRNASF